MRSKYAGDVGDFGKYGLLRALCRRDQHGEKLRLGVVWYFVSEKGLEYLSQEGQSRFAGCDDDLYAKLQRIVQARSLSFIERANVLPRNTVFFRESVRPSSIREEWLDRAVDKVKDCEVVFLDPDTGLRDSLDRDNARRTEYAYLDEVSKFPDSGDHKSIVVYHHLGRRRHDEQITEWLALLRQQFPRRSPFALRFRPYSPRAFLVLPARAHERLLLKRANAFLQTRWGRGKKPHFNLILGK